MSSLILEQEREQQQKALPQQQRASENAAAAGCYAACGRRRGFFFDGLLSLGGGMGGCRLKCSHQLDHCIIWLCVHQFLRFPLCMSCLLGFFSHSMDPVLPPWRLVRDEEPIVRTGVEGSFRINREEKVFTILSITTNQNDNKLSIYHYMCRLRLVSR